MSGSRSDLDEGLQYLRMDGRNVFKWAVNLVTDTVELVLAKTGMTVHDVSLYVLHQANIRIIEATAKHANVSMDKVYVNVERYGNTSSASVPIALDEAIANGRIRDGMNVLLVAFGAGFTWASMVLRF